MYDKAEEAAESGDHAKAGILLKICKGLSQQQLEQNELSSKSRLYERDPSKKAQFNRQ
ncbi:hypothetical protein PtB15_8B144 [Puccinia triticina]|nr:hypothetical protein PtB15_8B144 [Puccinia triticina]